MSLKEICGNCVNCHIEPNGSGTCMSSTGPENIGALDPTKGPEHNYNASRLPGDAIVWKKHFKTKGKTCFVPKS